MLPEEALIEVQKRFPFKGYMDPLKGYVNVASTVVRHLPPGSTILDFGSGPCDKTAVLQVLGYTCTAIDDLSDHWHTKNGNKELILEFIQNMGIRYSSGLDLEPPHGGYDMLMMQDVLEHLHNSPRCLVNNLLELVKPGGLFFATVPNAVNIRKRISVLFGRTNLPNFDLFYWYPDPWRGHVREYTKTDLQRLVTFLALEILELRGCHHMLEVLPRFVRPIYTSVTLLFPAWRDTWLLVARKPKNWLPVRTLPPEQFAKIMKQL